MGETVSLEDFKQVFCLLYKSGCPGDLLMQFIEKCSEKVPKTENERRFSLRLKAAQRQATMDGTTQEASDGGQSWSRLRVVSNHSQNGQVVWDDVRQVLIAHWTPGPGVPLQEVRSFDLGVTWSSSFCEL